MFVTGKPFTPSLIFAGKHKEPTKERASIRCSTSTPQTSGASAFIIMTLVIITMLIIMAFRLTTLGMMVKMWTQSILSGREA